MLTSTGFKQQRICTPLVPTRNKIIYKTVCSDGPRVRKTFSKPASLKKASLVYIYITYTHTHIYRDHETLGHMYISIYTCYMYTRSDVQSFSFRATVYQKDQKTNVRSPLCRLRNRPDFQEELKLGSTVKTERKAKSRAWVKQKCAVRCCEPLES